MMHNDQNLLVGAVQIVVGFFMAMFGAIAAFVSWQWLGIDLTEAVPWGVGGLIVGIAGLGTMKRGADRNNQAEARLA